MADREFQLNPSYSVNMYGSMYDGFGQILCIMVSEMKISDFQTKDVINIIDGKKLGQVSDIELDLKQGRIESIIVPNYSKFMGLFGRGRELVILWHNIVKIGADVVLVRIEELNSAQGEGYEGYDSTPLIGKL